MIEWELYEDNIEILTDDLIRELRRGERSARWKLVLIFKSEIIKAATKLAMVLNKEFGRPNNGPEVEWLEEYEAALVTGYSTSYRLDYWGNNMEASLRKGGNDDE